MSYVTRKSCVKALSVAGALLSGATFATAALAEWAPTKTVELIVPAGTGGGADQMARMLQGIIQKNDLMPQSMVVINRSGGAGAEGFLDMVASKADPHKLVITLSNVFTTPLATGVPFHWDDLTPVQMLALDNFILWTNSSKPYKTSADFIEAAKAGGFKIGGTGSKQEDQIITAAIEQATGDKFTYIPFKGGGDVAAQLVGNHIDASVNNPIEAVSHWDGGALTPLCVFAEEQIEAEKWAEVPTCKSQGLDVEYQMLRGIFMAADVDPEAIAYYDDLFDRVRETEDWKAFMANGAFSTRSISGDEFQAWLETAADQHKTLMTEAGFIK